jgi:biopolymer transport protein ExbD
MQEDEMAVSLTPAGPANRKALDSELNLVPFIDLLICCICFLLITAVWVQLAHVPATLRSPAPSEGPSSDALQLRMLVGHHGYVLSANAERVVIPKQGSAYDDQGLGRRLRTLRANLGGGSPAITVAAEDGIAYRHLIRAMDLVLTQGFGQIQVSDDRAAL